MPLAPIPRPSVATRKFRSHRLRSRFQRQYEVWREAMKLLTTVNSLYKGRCGQRTECQKTARKRISEPTTLAQSQAHSYFLRESHRLVCERRRLGPRARSVYEFLKIDATSRYGDTAAKSVARTRLDASLLDEPDTERVVPMLAALPPEEATFYSCEQNVVDWNGKSSAIVEELEEQYAFVAGSLDQYVAYLNRSDLPGDMWCYKALDQVKAFGGFAAVDKKNQRQRKLLMGCSANYIFSDVRKRENHGLMGGGALCRLHIPSDHLAVAAFDESNAFTSVATPAWMWSYAACPPVRAAAVWGRLTPDQQLTFNKHDWVAPCYRRMAMGNSHSVHIIMAINMYTVGKVLVRNRRLICMQEDAEIDDAVCHQCDASEVSCSEDESAECDEVPVLVSDEDWLENTSARVEILSGTRLRPSEWLQELRELRRSEERILTVVHFFGGVRRHGDLEHFLQARAQQAGLRVHCTTVDTEQDPSWDLANPVIFAMVMEAVEEGLLDIGVGGPPCATWARSRFRRSPGPRPVRLRGIYTWGLPSLRQAERRRVEEGNTLLINALAIFEGISRRGGAHLLEHPRDPGAEPFPSIWCTDEVRCFEERTGSVRRELDQCMTGQSALKGTTLSTTLARSELFDLRCDGLHRHTFRGGRDSAGLFRTRKLQTFSPKMCDLIAEACIATLADLHRSGRGPTGWCRSEVPTTRISVWSTTPSVMRGFGCAILNEDAVRGRTPTIRGSQAAFYLHVDDGAFIADGDRACIADELMEKGADGLVDEGFVVTDRTGSRNVQKIVGYEIVRKPATFRFPLTKSVELQDCMRELIAQDVVDTSIVRSLLGVWIWGSLLRRETLSIPHAIFRFCEKCPDQWAVWWPSARREFRAMSNVIGILAADVGAPLAPTIFATDAQGANDLSSDDHGGWGAVATDVSPELAERCLLLSQRPGKTVTKLSGEFQGLKRPDLAIARNIPFTRLPRELFESNRSWEFIGNGRWRFPDHITLGEARAVNVVLELLAGCPEAHRRRVLSLEDNMAAACAYAKGRSPAPALNYLLRRRAALSLAARLQLALPWTETSLQPADEASRLSGALRPPAP